MPHQIPRTLKAVRYTHLDQLQQLGYSPAQIALDLMIPDLHLDFPSYMMRGAVRT